MPETDAQKKRTRKYQQTEKGREAKRRANLSYRHSEKGKIARAEAQRRYRAKKRLLKQTQGNS